MKLVIREYWNTVTDTGEKLAKVNRGEYELKNYVAYPESGWESVDSFRKSAKDRTGYLGEVEPGKFKFDRGRSWGIHSYQIISIE